MKRLLLAVFSAAALGAGVLLLGPHMVPQIVPYLTVFGDWHTARKEAAQKTPAPAPAPAVSVAKVVEADFTEMITVSGSLVPRDEILVAPEIEGFRVLKLNVDEGDRVKKGDVLATLVQESLDAQLAQNTASLARAAAAISQSESQIIEAKARLAEAEANFERAKPLKNSGYLSGTTFDQREASAKTTAAQLNAAQDGLRLAQAEKLQVEAQRRELTWKHANTEVTAPADGLVSRRTARIGGMASGAAEPMFRIIARSEIELDAEVIETELAKISTGQTAQVDVAGVGNVEGTVRLVSPEVDKLTRLGRVRIFFGADPRLRIGTFARGSIAAASSHGLAVPSSAVVFDSAGAFVQVVRDGRVERRSIETGLIARGLVEVRSGVAAGDVVVARAGTFLRHGDAVRAVEPDPKISEAR
ncbi:MAG: efflux RND transporter periplasmic adaptor subunit [Hyphomicrobium sp.]|jgi:RND family efflux transporter MFP subunit